MMVYHREVQTRLIQWEEGSKLARLVTEERPKGTTVCLHWQKLGPFTPFCETGPLKRQFFFAA